jgi:protein-L-isoaspartate(D-aspartate) O-methyltransferase
MRPPAGTPNTEAQRMVRLQMENRDISDPRVLEAMRRVPRHLFVSAESRAAAYEDHPLPIGHGQTISQPYMVAFMTQALQLRGSERVLEIGTGSGYQTAILSELCSEVFSVERIPELSAAAERTLASLGYYEVHLLAADGSLGWVQHAPYDRILVAAAAPQVPTVLCDQLADNGIMIVPVGDWRRTQEIVVAHRTGTVMSVERSIGCRFVPLVGRGGFEG